MSSRLIVNSIRHTGASSDAITFDNTGKCAFPNNTGNILQVVEHAFTTETSSTSTSSVSIGGSSKTLTLTSSTSKVLILANIYCWHTRSYSGQGMDLKIQRTVGGSATDIYVPKSGFNGRMFFFDTSQLAGTTGRGMQLLMHLDSPSNTSVTYELYGTGYTSSNSATWAVNRTDNGDTATSSIVFMEVAG
tara:strand:+ start:289 stop:858 length:570 start_codon:yes stop_codon:yes gene_type:complete